MRWPLQRTDLRGRAEQHEASRDGDNADQLWIGHQVRLMEREDLKH
jgi:hypothetical protein